jgi:nickel/cobalt transporter (NicO) family protein
MVSALIVAAVSIAALHALAPDHWVPFAALARSQRWSAVRTASVTAVCGAGHVTVSVVIGIAGAVFGIGLFESFGAALEGVAPFVLIGFGLAYAAWGGGRILRERWHRRMHAAGAPHHHHSHHHLDHYAASARALFLLFCADPCVAVIPLMLAAVPAGWTAALAVVAAYELATIATMVALVLPARAATRAVTAGWVDRFGDLLAGGVIAMVGVLVIAAGI